MTPIQRRNWLLSIFYCRTPETRDRRIAKMLEDALARAEGKPEAKPRPKKLPTKNSGSGPLRPIPLCSLRTGILFGFLVNNN